MRRYANLLGLTAAGLLAIAVFCGLMFWFGTANQEQATWGMTALIIGVPGLTLGILWLVEQTSTE